MTHNHPSGIPDPSEDDIRTTKGLVEAGTIMVIDALDHIIIGDTSTFKSIRELGLI